MSSSWYEDGQEVGMKLGMNMAKIFGRQLFMAIDDFYEQLFMAIDDFYDYGYRLFLLSAR